MAGLHVVEKIFSHLRPIFRVTGGFVVVTQIADNQPNFEVNDMLSLNYITRDIKLSYFLIRAHFYAMEGFIFWVTKTTKFFIIIIEISGKRILSEVVRPWLIMGGFIKFLYTILYVKNL